MVELMEEVRSRRLSTSVFELPSPRWIRLNHSCEGKRSGRFFKPANSDFDWPIPPPILSTSAFAIGLLRKGD